MARLNVLDALYDLAEGQDGYLTTKQATKQGISRVSLAKAEHRGRLQRISRGVYRLVRYPYQAGKAQYWEAVLWPQARLDVRGVLSYQTALVLHNLSDANPIRVHLTLPPGFPQERQPPRWLSIHHDKLAHDEIVVVDGLPVTSITRTLYDISSTNDLATFEAAIASLRARGHSIPKGLLPE